MSSDVMRLDLINASITDVHSQDGFNGVGHGGTDNNEVTFIRNTRTISLSSDKMSLTSIVHTVKKTVVALLLLSKKSHSKPVAEKVSIVGHGEHYRHDMVVVVQVGIEKVVGEDTNGSCRGSCCLVEKGPDSRAGPDHGGQRDLTVAALQEQPGNEDVRDQGVRRRSVQVIISRTHSIQVKS